jgi:hypothetical protein
MLKKATLALGAALLALPVPAVSAGRADLQTTTLLTRSIDGGVPNGPSTHPVISGDRRYSRLIAFESEASDLVRGDTNGHKDVFAINRGGSYANEGTPWRAGSTILVSRGRGRPADGPSFGASVSGDFRKGGSCVAFLSAATNLVRGDTNGKVDAFLVRSPGRAPSRVSLPAGRQAGDDTTHVAVSATARACRSSPAAGCTRAPGARRARSRRRAPPRIRRTPTASRMRWSSPPPAGSTCPRTARGARGSSRRAAAIPPI